MRTRSRRSRLLVVLATVLLACGDYGSLGDHASETGTGAGSETQGTESDGTGSGASSDLVFFEGGECKGEPGEIYRGLNCIAWDTTDSEVTKFDLFNFREACGLGPESWQGEASVEPDGTVELRMLSPDCGGGDSCPSRCLYDGAFGVANVPTNDELALWVQVGAWICPEDWDGPTHTPDPEEVSLPLGSEPIGAVCRYADLVHDFMDSSICGTLFMPCRTACEDDPVDPPCDDGLVCAVTVEPDEPVCHPTCEVDEDCPWDGVLSCQDGLCRPADPW